MISKHLSDLTSLIIGVASIIWIIQGETLYSLLCLILLVLTMIYSKLKRR